MQATARRRSVVAATSCAPRHLIRGVEKIMDQIKSFHRNPSKRSIDLPTNLPSLSESLSATKRSEREEALKLLRKRTSWGLQSVFLVLVLSMSVTAGNHSYLTPYLIGGVYAYSWFQTRSISRRLDALILLIRDDQDHVINDD